jgi:type VI secretion system protein VasD
MLGSCSSLNSTVGEFFKFDTDLTIAFKVDADINPDDRKTPSPLFIRMYEFKATKMFEKANFLDIFEKDKEALGADLVAKQRLKRLKPGEDAEFSFVLDKSTQYVGIYAEFLEYKNATYKVIIPVVKSNVITTSATIHVSGNTIRVSP